MSHDAHNEVKSADFTGQKLVFAVDDSEEARYAVKWVLKHFVTKGDHVIFFTVYSFSPVQLGHFKDASEAALFNSQLRKAVEQNATSLLENFAYHYQRNGVKTECVAVPKEGRPVKQEICAFVDKARPDLLLLASRGLGKLKRLFLGSVSKYCIAHASCSTLVVRQDENILSSNQVDDEEELLEQLHIRERNVEAVDEEDGKAEE